MMKPWLVTAVLAVGLALSGGSVARASLVSLDSAMAATQDATQAAVAGDLLVAQPAAILAPADTLVVAGQAGAVDTRQVAGMQLCGARRDRIEVDHSSRDYITRDAVTREGVPRYPILRDHIGIDPIGRDRINDDGTARDPIKVDQ